MVLFYFIVSLIITNFIIELVKESKLRSFKGKESISDGNLVRQIWKDELGLIFKGINRKFHLETFCHRQICSLIQGDDRHVKVH